MKAGRKQAKESKPRIVLICTSGGGVRAAVWTMVVLEGLEQALRGDPGAGQAALRDHIRLFTGASGGMVGAGLYVANFENGPIQAARVPDTELGTLSSLLAKDSLRRTLQTMVLVDQPTLFWPGKVTWDRGREIERVWGRTHRFARRHRSLSRLAIPADICRLERVGTTGLAAVDHLLAHVGGRCAPAFWSATSTFSILPGLMGMLPALSRSASMRISTSVPIGRSCRCRRSNSSVSSPTRRTRFKLAPRRG